MKTIKLQDVLHALWDSEISWVELTIVQEHKSHSPITLVSSVSKSYCYYSDGTEGYETNPELNASVVIGEHTYLTVEELPEITRVCIEKARIRGEEFGGFSSWVEYDNDFDDTLTDIINSFYRKYNKKLEKDRLKQAAAEAFLD